MRERCGVGEKLLAQQTFVVHPENAYFILKNPSYHYLYGEGHDIFSSIPRLTAWSFQGVTNG